MASVIRLRRKKNDSTQDTSTVALLAGEPFYDAAKKNLYVGNNDGETLIGKASFDDDIVDSIEENIPLVVCNRKSRVTIGFVNMTRIVFDCPGGDSADMLSCFVSTLRSIEGVKVTVEDTRIAADFSKRNSLSFTVSEVEPLFLRSITVCTGTLPPASGGENIVIPSYSAVLHFGEAENRKVCYRTQQVWEANGISFINDKAPHKKHIAEITSIGRDNSPVIFFRIGEDNSNTFSHIVNNVESANGLTLDPKHYGENLPTSEPHVAGRVFFVKLQD